MIVVNSALKLFGERRRTLRSTEKCEVCASSTMIQTGRLDSYFVHGYVLSYPSNSVSCLAHSDVEAKVQLTESWHHHPLEV